MNYLADSSSFAALAWLVIGLALCAVETLAPGAFFIWVGAAAAIVGVVDYVVPMYLKTQFVLFGALVAALVLIGLQVYGSFGAEPGPLPQSRAHAMIGQDFFLDEAIVRGYGRIRVGDSSWRVAGADCPAGAKVRVIAVEDGSLLRVERDSSRAADRAPSVPDRPSASRSSAIDQHRNGRVGEHLDGLAAEQQRRHAAPPMRGHHDQVADLWHAPCR